MEISIDQKSCSGCGLCVALCPDIFEMNEDDKTTVENSEIPDEMQESCRNACDECPENAIYID